MEPKYRTLVQAAVFILALAVLVIHHNTTKDEQAMAQKTATVGR